MLLMTSCATTPIDHPVEVKVPVAIECPVPPTLPPIDDPVSHFDAKITIEQSVLDLRASRVLWRDRAKQLDILLDVYRQRKQPDGL
jgi:hypothetical protein